MKQAGIASIASIALTSGVASAQPPGHDRRRTRGRLEPLGRALPPENDPNRVTYTFDVSGKPARGRDGGGPGDHYDLDAVLGTD